MHRRISEQPRDKRHKRKRNPILALICEGSSTEPIYFSNFKGKDLNNPKDIVECNPNTNIQDLILYLKSFYKD